MNATLINICRCCLTTNVELTDSTYETKRNKSFRHVHSLMYCFPDLKLIEYGTSYMLCGGCATVLKTTRRFKQRTYESNVTFARLVDELGSSDDGPSDRVPDDVKHSGDVVDVKLEPLIEIVELEGEIGLNDVEYPKIVDVKTEDGTKTSNDDDDDGIKRGGSSSNEKPYRCDVCSYTSLYRNCLNKHRARQHEGERSHGCSYCDETFRTIVDAAAHEENEHGEERTLRSDPKFNPLRCTTCKCVYASAESLKCHRQSQHKSDVPKGKKVRKKKDDGDDDDGGASVKQKRVRKKLMCMYCSVMCANVSALKNHERVHTGQKPYACGYCPKSFRTATSLKMHVRIHTGERPYECKYCKKRFHQGTTLRTHVRIHTGERPFKCDFCDKTFPCTRSKNLHTRTHTGEKPYTCGVCNETFSYSANLRRHLRAHDDVRPYECTYCKKTFPRASNLNRHVLIHTGEKPFECDVCNRRFIQKEALKSHQRVHKKDGPSGVADSTTGTTTTTTV